MLHIKRKLRSLRRLFRYKWCYFLTFTVSFVSFVLIVGYWQFHLEGGNWDHDHDGHVEGVGVLKGVKILQQKRSAKVDQTGDSAFVNPSAITEFKPGVVGNYENRPVLPAPGYGPGENGRAVQAAGSAAEVRKANMDYGFNVVASDKISLNRSIPDTRPDECRYWHYPERLPTATVTIVFHNEAWTPLLRTVHSVLLRTPPDLLAEILMIDDFSAKPHLKEPLDKYLEQFQGKVRLLRNPERKGLIGSRSVGAANAKGDVVVFLDAHCEANVNWLPPLLAPIAKDRRVMTVPVIDSIDMNTWAYHPQYGSRSDVLFRGIFEWGLLYKEAQLPPKERQTRSRNTEPFK